MSDSSALPEAFPNAVTELGALALSTGLQADEMTLAILYDLLDGPRGLRSVCGPTRPCRVAPSPTWAHRDCAWGRGCQQHPDQIKPFLQTVAAGQALLDWGIVDPDQGTLVSLFIDTVATTYSAETFAYGTRPRGPRPAHLARVHADASVLVSTVHRAAVAGGGGLFSRRSVQEWLFDYTDPLLSLFQPPATPERPAVTNAFRHSDVSEADARSYKKPWRMYTGLNNISQVRPAGAVQPSAHAHAS